jgi:hypothetical protein
MSGIERRLKKLEDAWTATLEPHVTKNDCDRAKGHYGQLAREFAPLLIEETKKAIERAVAAERAYESVVQANQRLIEERDRMIVNGLQAQREIQRLKDVIARLNQP